jgi:hypothetical protein
MKALGIQIKSTGAILVVLKKDAASSITQTDECTKFEIADIYDSQQVRRFRDQINVALETIKPTKVGICKRNANGKGKMAPSPASFKLEGIIQLYDKIEIEFVAPQTVQAFLKKNPCPTNPKNKYQQDAFDLAYLLLMKP